MGKDLNVIFFMDAEIIRESPYSYNEEILDPPYITGVSITGLSHEKIKLPCQDANKFVILESGISIVAIADGLGSAEHSEIGAATAVESVIHFITKYLEENTFSLVESPALFKKSIEFARNKLGKKADAEHHAVQSYACTLILILFFNKTAIVAHIGDGAVIAKIQQRYQLISPPEEQEYINEVTPITSSLWEKSLRISSFFSDIDNITAFTDGCQRSILTKSNGVLEANGPFLEAFYRYLKNFPTRTEKEGILKELVGSKKFSEISDDDKTLVIAVLS